MKELNTAALLQIVQTPLVEWRRLPVKHPQQINQRNQVISAIEELSCRIVRQENQLQLNINALKDKDLIIAMQQAEIQHLKTVLETPRELIISKNNKVLKVF